MLNRSAPAVIIAVTESDVHVVGNRLLEMALLKEGFRVINLGVCTSTQDLVEAYRSNDNIIAIAIGSINGHAGQDLSGFGQLRRDYQISCKIFFGGYMEVGRRARMEDFSEDRLEVFGIDEILDDIPQLVTRLIRLRQEKSELDYA
jgi:methylaspartate mutase sigma subunit